VTLGCARNEVDSEELAARLDEGGWELVGDAADADAVLVNTCGFVEAAKKDSIDALLEADSARGGAASGGPKAVVAVGCLAERYGAELAGSLPEADAVLGFDAYPAIAAHLDAVLAGSPPPSHRPRDRRTLLPISPARRQAAAAAVATPGHGDDGPRPLGVPVLRRRLGTGPVAPLKISSGCDRRCAFCAIPTFRGSHVSRDPDDILAEAEWLAADGVRELVLVSENATSYGKDLGDVRALEKLLPQLAAVDGVVRVRTVYLQPAEVRPSLLEVLLTTPGVAPYLDLSFQHASPEVLRRMRRFGGAEHFTELLSRARGFAPRLGARSNVIVGFPGETKADVAVLSRFLAEADLDAVGVFAYSDEDGTEAVSLPGKVARATITRRYSRITDLVEQLTAARAERRVGERVEVLVTEVADGLAHGHAAHQQPEADGGCVVRLPTATPAAELTAGPGRVVAGDLVAGTVIATVGVDLVAEFDGVVDGIGRHTRASRRSRRGPA
jgi:ribosomal protein S12 methylthiotransferase RimO